MPVTTTPVVAKAPIVPSPSPPPSKIENNETQICVKLPHHFVEYIRDFQHHEAIRTGALHFSFKDAISVMIANHQICNPGISPRPAIVKAAEKKTGRKRDLYEGINHGAQ